MVYERNTLVKIAGIRGGKIIMEDLRIDRVNARVRLGPFSFTISQDEVAEEKASEQSVKGHSHEKCPKCSLSWDRPLDCAKYRFCPHCATPLENP